MMLTFELTGFVFFMGIILVGLVTKMVLHIWRATFLESGPNASYMYELHKRISASIQLFGVVGALMVVSEKSLYVSVIVAALVVVFMLYVTRSDWK